MHLEEARDFDLLNHGCKVVRPSHTFLHRTIDPLSATGRTGLCHSHHHICLNREFRADLAWWRCFQSSGMGLNSFKVPS